MNNIEWLNCSINDFNKEQKQEFKDILKEIKGHKNIIIDNVGDGYMIFCKRINVKECIEANFWINK